MSPKTVYVLVATLMMANACQVGCAFCLIKADLVGEYANLVAAIAFATGASTGIFAVLSALPDDHDNINNINIIDDVET